MDQVQQFYVMMDNIEFHVYMLLHHLHLLMQVL